MPKATAPNELNRVQTFEDLRRFVSLYLAQLTTIVNGNLGVLDNLRVRLLEVNFTVANQEVRVFHTLGYTPNGYILCGSNVATSIYNGTTANSTEFIFLRSSAVAQAKVLIF